MIVISDTSPVNYLLRLGELSLLRHLFKEIHLPLTVYTELMNFSDNAKEVSEAIEGGWLHVTSPKTEIPAKFKSYLDEGEAAAIALALELDAALVLIDERRGRIIARKLDLRTFGLVGVLVEAKQEGLIQAVKPYLDTIIQFGFRISLRFYKRILIEVNE